MVSDVADIQDKGEGNNAIVMLRGRGTDPDTGELVAETTSTAVIRQAGGFGGCPASGPSHPSSRTARPTPASTSHPRGSALIYRLSGDRNPLHSDPWFAKEMAGFPKPILHGLCTYGVSGRALVSELGKGVAANITSIAARFTSPVFPGETLSTLIWRTEPGKAVYRTEAAGADGASDNAARWCSTTARWNTRRASGDRERGEAGRSGSPPSGLVARNPLGPSVIVRIGDRGHDGERDHDQGDREVIGAPVWRQQDGPVVEGPANASDSATATTGSTVSMNAFRFTAACSDDRSRANAMRAIGTMMN